MSRKRSIEVRKPFEAAQETLTAYDKSAGKPISTTLFTFSCCLTSWLLKLACSFCFSFLDLSRNSFTPIAINPPTNVNNTGVNSQQYKDYSNQIQSQKADIDKMKQARFDAWLAAIASAPADETQE